MHSLVDGKISCFQIVAIISSLYEKSLALFSINMLFFLGFVKLWNWIVTPCLTFWVTTRRLSNVTAPLTLSSAMYEDSSSCTFCQHLLLSFFLVTAIHVIVELYIIMVLIWIFLTSNYAKHLLAYVHVIIGHLYIFGEMAIQVCTTFLNGHFSFYYWVIRVIYIFWVQVPHQIYDLLLIIFSLS